MIIYQIYQLVGGFPAKFVSSRTSQNIFFHMLVIWASISFLRGGGGAFPKLVFTFKGKFAFLASWFNYEEELTWNKSVKFDDIPI